MRYPRTCLSVRSLLIVIALIGLNLAGGVTALRSIPTVQIPQDVAWDFGAEAPGS